VSFVSAKDAENRLEENEYANSYHNPSNGFKTRNWNDLIQDATQRSSSSGNQQDTIKKTNAAEDNKQHKKQLCSLHDGGTAKYD